MNTWTTVKARLRAPRPRQVNRSRTGTLVIFLFLAATALFVAFPMVYAVSNSLKPPEELWEYPPRMFPRNPSLANYRDLFSLMGESWVPISRYLFNTVFVTAAGTAGHVICASMCAYPLAKMEFRGKKSIFKIIVTALIFNQATLAIPSYIVIARIGWLDTYQSIIVPAIGGTLGLYLMKQFMDNIPDALLEAAVIDGAGEWKRFTCVVMPQVKPAWITLVILQMQALWNMQGSASIYREDMKTLPYALNQVISSGYGRVGAGSAVVVVMMLVPIAVFFISQNQVLETMSSSGIKG